ncbi:hypothetical protein STEG23_022430, partial [Scotinomys teguina]
MTNGYHFGQSVDPERHMQTVLLFVLNALRSSYDITHWSVFLFKNDAALPLQTMMLFVDIFTQGRRYPYLPEGLPYALEVVTHKEARGLFMRLWGILETSVAVLTQEQDNQNKECYETLTKLPEIRILP